MDKINVLDNEITFYRDVIKNWTRRKDTIEFLGLWERIKIPISAELRGIFKY